MLCGILQPKQDICLVIKQRAILFQINRNFDTHDTHNKEMLFVLSTSYPSVLSESFFN